jgi:hypothetical protein
VDAGVQGFYPAVQDFWKTGKIGYFDDWNSLISYELGGSSGREQLDIVLVQAPRKFGKPGFVGNTY